MQRKARCLATCACIYTCTCTCAGPHGARSGHAMDWAHAVARGAYLFFILPRSGTVVTGATGRSEPTGLGGEVSYMRIFTILFCCMPLAMVFLLRG